jgi:DNA repair exonuclease SbcCD ATPase subunit
MDLGEAVDRLYGLPRERFVAERDRLAKAEPALADRIRKLRKPTVAAWQANQLARKRRKDLAALVALGHDLRAAQEKLDGPALRTLSRQRVEALDRLVGRLPDPATGLRELLERAITDPDAAEDLLAGRLVSEPEGSGWGFELAMPAPGAEPKRDDRRRRKYEEAKAAEEEARQALVTAEEELQARTRRVTELQDELTEARAARDEAAATAKQARQEAQRRAKEVGVAERRLAGS